MGAALAQLASQRWLRRLGAVVVGAGWLVASRLRAPAVGPVRLPAPVHAWAPHSEPVRAKAA